MYNNYYIIDALLSLSVKGSLAIYFSYNYASYRITKICYSLLKINN